MEVYYRTSGVLSAVTSVHHVAVISTKRPTIIMQFHQMVVPTI